MDYGGRCEDSLHRAGQPVGDRLDTSNNRVFAD